MGIKKFSKINRGQQEQAEKQIIQEMKIYDYDTLEYPIEVIRDKYLDGIEDDENDIYLPDYQREFVWDEKRQAKFIESLILNVPIPYIFVADVEGRKEIVDGSQRIRAICSFLSNKLRLQELEKLTSLNGFYFKDLSITRQRRFKNKSIKMIILSEKTDSLARQDLFERINTGSEDLKQIEVIKGAYAGNFYSFVEECANNKLFKNLCPISKKRALREEGPQRVLRYFAYTEKLDDYHGVVGKFIEKYVKSKSKKGVFTDSVKESMMDSFIEMLRFVDKYFPYGFKKTKNSKSTPRVRFEAISIGVHFALLKNPLLIPETMKWLESDEFKHHTRSDAANNTSKVKGRINFVTRNLLGE